jgi:hypothetical protein
MKARTGKVPRPLIDAHERRAGLRQPFRGALGEVRMALEIRLGAPVPIPARVKENSSATHLVRCERNLVDRCRGARIDSDHDALEIRHRFER